uniref:NADH-ubiquinone oxidoreductase chain 3 n=1 Tax=Cucujoidea sp. 22 KM-2017 TaxID=2219359 RepID=A0A346RI89_9CUCU|nr:NADH dehydrogenase subunit 3 [Cucujoidea sp. 22 KM-2017]
MNFMFLISMIIFLISFIMLGIGSLISKKSFNDREKISPFECGFNPQNLKRLPFSLHFFLISLIFLIFDIELTLLLPLILTLKITKPMYLFLYSMIFIIILLMGLYHEWNQNILNWII